MADTTKKPSDDLRKSINESGSNTAALTGKFNIDPNTRINVLIEVKNSMPPPPNPNKDKGTK